MEEDVEPIWPIVCLKPMQLCRKIIDIAGEQALFLEKIEKCQPLEQQWEILCASIWQKIAMGRAHAGQECLVFCQETFMTRLCIRSAGLVLFVSCHRSCSFLALFGYV